MFDIISKNNIIIFRPQPNYYINSSDVELLVCQGRKVYSETPERDYILNKLESLLYDYGLQWRNKLWAPELENYVSEEDKRQAQKLFPELY